MLKVRATSEDTDAIQKLWAGYLELMPTDRSAWLSLGEYHLARGDIGDAERVFRAAVAQHADDGLSMGALGHTLMLLGQLNEARSFLEAAVEQLPDEVGLHETLLTCLNAIGDEDAAHSQQNLIEDLRRGAR